MQFKLSRGKSFDNKVNKIIGVVLCIGVIYWTIIFLQAVCQPGFKL
jgi:hypothetical protein